MYVGGGGGRSAGQGFRECPHSLLKECRGEELTPVMGEGRRLGAAGTQALVRAEESGERTPFYRNLTKISGSRVGSKGS